MKTSDAIDKIMPAYIAARKTIHPAGKSGNNKFDRYEYAKEIDWHEAVIPELLKYDLVVLFSCEGSRREEPRTTDRGKTEFVTIVTGKARLFHSSGQWLEVDGKGEGVDRADKGIYKAQTGLKKYLYSLLFALPTTDDPEADNSHQQNGNTHGHNNQTTQQQPQKPTVPPAQVAEQKLMEKFGNDIGDGKPWNSLAEIKDYLARAGSYPNFDNLIKAAKPEHKKMLFDKLEGETRNRRDEIKSSLAVNV